MSRLRARLPNKAKDQKIRHCLTSNGSGPDHGVASPMLFGGYPLHHLLNLNSVARSAARGVRRARNTLG
jgi:hypothetical protein